MKGLVLAAAIFARLLPVVGGSARDLRLSVDERDASIFSYYLPRIRVSLSRGLLERLGASSAALVFVLSHELGHAVQHQDASWLEARSAFTQAQIEAHADMVGGRIAERAGFSVETFLAGERELFAALERDRLLRPWTWNDGYGGYPSWAVRRANMERWQRIVDARSDGPTPADFTPEGAFKP